MAWKLFCFSFIFYPRALYYKKTKRQKAGEEYKENALQDTYRIYILKAVGCAVWAVALEGKVVSWWCCHNVLDGYPALHAAQSKPSRSTSTLLVLEDRDASVLQGQNIAWCCTNNIKKKIETSRWWPLLFSFLFFFLWSIFLNVSNSHNDFSKGHRKD